MVSGSRRRQHSSTSSKSTWSDSDSSSPQLLLKTKHRFKSSLSRDIFSDYDLKNNSSKEKRIIEKFEYENKRPIKRSKCQRKEQYDDERRLLVNSSNFDYEIKTKKQSGYYDTQNKERPFEYEKQDQDAEEDKVEFKTEESDSFKRKVDYSVDRLKDTEHDKLFTDRRDDEGRLRRDDEDRLRRDDEDRLRRDDEDRLRRNDEGRLRRDDEDRLRRDDEGRLRRDDEDRLRRDDEGRLRKDDEKRHRKDDEKRHRKDYEDRHRRNYENRYRRDDEERHRRDDEERHRRDDEDRHRRDYEDRYRRDYENRHRRDYEDRHRRDDEERHRRDVEDRHIREDKERHKREDKERHKREESGSHNRRETDKYVRGIEDAYRRVDEDRGSREKEKEQQMRESRDKDVKEKRNETFLKKNEESTGRKAHNEVIEDSDSKKWDGNQHVKGDEDRHRREDRYKFTRTVGRTHRDKDAHKYNGDDETRHEREHGDQLEKEDEKNKQILVEAGLHRKEERGKQRSTQEDKEKNNVERNNDYELIHRKKATFEDGDKRLTRNKNNDDTAEHQNIDKKKSLSPENKLAEDLKKKKHEPQNMKTHEDYRSEKTETTFFQEYQKNYKTRRGNGHNERNSNSYKRGDYERKADDLGSEENHRRGESKSRSKMQHRIMDQKKKDSIITAYGKKSNNEEERNEARNTRSSSNEKKNEQHLKKDHFVRKQNELKERKRCVVREENEFEHKSEKSNTEREHQNAYKKNDRSTYKNESKDRYTTNEKKDRYTTENERKYDKRNEDQYLKERYGYKMREEKDTQYNRLEKSNKQNSNRIHSSTASVENVHEQNQRSSTEKEFETDYRKEKEGYYERYSKRHPYNEKRSYNFEKDEKGSMNKNYTQNRSSHSPGHLNKTSYFKSHYSDGIKKKNHINQFKVSSLKKGSVKENDGETKRSESNHRPLLDKEGTYKASQENAEILNEKEDKTEMDPELKEYIKKKIQKKTVDLIGRTGGVYIPPFKLEELQQKATDKSSVEYQRQSWDALRKSINGLINKVNIGNITNLVQDLFRENLLRGRGLVARSIIRAQMASPGFTHIYASLLSIINSKLPEIGDLVLRRILLQFRRAYRRNDKIVCKACMKFLAHLVNHKMVHELLALQLTMLLLEKVTDDSIEICVEFMQEVGQILQDISPQAFRVINDRIRSIAQEGTVDRRVQYVVEGLQRTVATKFVEFPGVLPELDLVEEEDKITHEVDLLQPDLKGDEMLNIFQAETPESFLQHEAEWVEISAEILGEQAEDDDSGNSSSEDSIEQEDEETDNKRTVQIHDMTEKDIIALRKTIYLTIMSSANFEECLHKLLKLNIREEQEIQVCTMLIDCNAMERTFQSFFALQAERLCRLKPVYQECFLNCLERQYAMIHHLETNKIRSTAKFFAHLFHTDALPWSALEIFVLTEETTTSASRIFIKVFLQELAEHMGLHDLHKRLCDASLTPHLHGLFPTDHPKNIRFSINFFTAIGLGGLTTSLREILTNLQAESVSSETETSTSDNSSTSTTSSSSRSHKKSSSNKKLLAPYKKLAPSDRKSSSSYEKSSAASEESSPVHKKPSPAYRKSSAPYRRSSPPYRRSSPPYRTSSPLYRRSSPPYKQSSHTYRRSSSNGFGYNRKRPSYTRRNERRS